MSELSPTDVRLILSLTALIKARPADFCGALAGKQLALFSEKPSLRTRLTFAARGADGTYGHLTLRNRPCRITFTSVPIP